MQMNWCYSLLKKISKTANKKESSDYFKLASSWYDDIYLTSIIRSKRYQMAFFGMMGLCALLVLAIVIMMPLHSTQLVVVHQGPSGYAWLDTLAPNTKISPNMMRTQSEIARYVEMREGYDPLLYHQQTDNVLMWSNHVVAGEYATLQDDNNKQSPINTLGTKGYRTVIINSILPLDSVDKNLKHQHKHHNLAQVNFVVTTHALTNGTVSKTPYTAIISWQYTGVPKTPQGRLHNWDGFEVTKYVVHEINTGNNS